MRSRLRAAIAIVALGFAAGALPAAAAPLPALETGPGHCCPGPGAEGYPSRLWAQNDAAPAPEASPPPEDAAPASEDADPLALWDDDGNGRITCGEARSHGIAPVTREHPAYPYMRDSDGDGVVCE